MTEEDFKCPLSGIDCEDCAVKAEEKNCPIQDFIKTLDKIGNALEKLSERT